MADIAVFSKEKHVSLKSVAERQNISEAYLEQLVAGLKRAHLLASVRGANGGYTLTRPADQVTIGEILRALESPVRSGQCKGLDGACGQGCDCCVSRSVWERIEDSINEVTDSILLSELVTKYEQLHSEIEEIEL